MTLIQKLREALVSAIAICDLVAQTARADPEEHADRIAELHDAASEVRAELDELVQQIDDSADQN